MKLKIGENPYCSNHDYHSDREYQSSSGLKLLLKDPSLYEEQYKTPIKPKISTDTQTFGSLVHCLLLEPERLDQFYAFYPGSRRVGKDFQKFKKANEPKEILTIKMLAKAQKLVKGLGKTRGYKNLLKGGASEVTACQVIDGVKCKARFDYIDVKKGRIIDIKTTRRPRGFENKQAESDENSNDIGSLWFASYDAMKFGYWLSAALYVRIAELTYRKKFEFIIVALSTKDGSSHLHCSRFLRTDLNRGQKQLDKALKKYKLLYQSKNQKK